MAQALELASYGLYTTYPNPAVGCVFTRQNKITRKNKIIGQGYHHRAGQPHAEIMALNDAGFDVKGATCYVTLEPCSHYGRTPPCAKKLVEQQIKRCVIATLDPNPKVSGRGIAMLKQAGIEVEVGLCEEEAKFLNRAFLKAIVSERPYVTVKVGMSLDARTALPDGSSKWITNKSSRAGVQDLRAKSDVIVTGAGTVLADNPRLDVRYEELTESVRAVLPQSELRQPVKVILDGRGRLSPDKFRLFSEGKVLWCVLGDTGGEPIVSRMLDGHVEKLVFKDAGGHIPLDVLWTELGRRQYRRVLVEAGQTLTTAVLKAGFCDEIYAFVAPKFLGRGSRDAFALPVCADLNLRAFRLYEAKALDGDCLMHFVREG